MCTKDKNREDRNFIMEHLNDDVAKLALGGNRFSVSDWEFVLQQIAARQRVKTKLPSWYNNSQLTFPATLSLEQCSSEITAQYKAELCAGETLLDLTTGFGVDLLTMAKQFTTVYGVEPNADLCNIVKKNAEALNIPQLTIFNETAEECLLSGKISNVEWLYIDPSRRNCQGERVNLQHYTPDIFALKSQLFGIARKILIKLSPMLDIKLLLREFPECEKVHIIAVENECKEILLEIDTENPTKENRVFTTLNITKKGVEHFQFSEEEEENCPLKTGTVTEGDFLYEPNAAIMKSGGYKTICRYYDIVKIHKNSHLYISKEKIETFPGRGFQVVQIIDNFRKDNLKKLLPEKAYNLTVRNFPESAETLKKRLKIHDGGNRYLFATTADENRHLLLCCRKES